MSEEMNNAGSEELNEQNSEHEHHHEHHHEHEHEHDHEQKEHSHGQSGTAVKHRYNLGENAFVLFIITFAAGTFCYEKYIPESFMKFYRPLIFAACIFTWLYLSLTSGYRNKWRFEIFSVIFWIFPLLEIYISYNGPEFCRNSTVLYVLSEFFTIMYITPAKMVGNIFNISGTAAIMIMALLCSFVFLAGTLLPEKNKKR